MLEIDDVVYRQANPERRQYAHTDNIDRQNIQRQIVFYEFDPKLTTSRDEALYRPGKDTRLVPVDTLASN
jgi:hypothetical protein